MKIDLHGETAKNVVTQLRAAGITGIVFIELDRRNRGDADPAAPFGNGDPLSGDRLQHLADQADADERGPDHGQDRTGGSQGDLRSAQDRPAGGGDISQRREQMTGDPGEDRFDGRQPRPGIADGIDRILAEGKGGRGLLRDEAKDRGARGLQEARQGLQESREAIADVRQAGCRGPGRQVKNLKAVGNRRQDRTSDRRGSTGERVE